VDSIRIRGKKSSETRFENVRNLLLTSLNFTADSLFIKIRFMPEKFIQIFIDKAVHTKTQPLIE